MFEFFMHTFNIGGQKHYLISSQLTLLDLKERGVVNFDQEYRHAFLLEEVQTLGISQHWQG